MEEIFVNTEIELDSLKKNARIMSYQMNEIENIKYIDEMILTGPHNWEQYPEKIKESKIMQEVYSICMLNEARKDPMDKETNITRIELSVSQTPHIFDKLQEDEKIIGSVPMIAFSLSIPSSIGYLENKSVLDEIEHPKMLTKDPLCIRYFKISKNKLKRSKLSCSIKGDAYKYVSSRLKKNIELATIALENGLKYEHVHKSICLNQKIINKAIESDGTSIKYIPEYLRTEELWLKAIESNHSAIRLLDEKYYNDKIFLLNALKRNKKCYIYIDSILDRYDDIKTEINEIMNDPPKKKNLNPIR